MLTERLRHNVFAEQLKVSDFVRLLNLFKDAYHLSVFAPTFEHLSQIETAQLLTPRGGPLRYGLNAHVVYHDVEHVHFVYLQAI